jgi:hypothetical protein
MKQSLQCDFAHKRVFNIPQNPIKFLKIPEKFLKNSWNSSDSLKNA